MLSMGHEMNLRIQVRIILVCKGRAMGQAVSTRSLTAEAWVRSRTIPCEICGEQSGIGTDVSPSTSVSHVSIIRPMLHTHLHLNTYYSCQKDKRVKHGNLQAKQ